jgi:hypothetical protein
MPPSDFVIETETLQQKAWAIYSGVEGDSPTLRAIVFDEALAKAICEAKHPNPEEEQLLFDADYVPARIPEVEIQCPNDYRIRTHDEWGAAESDLPNDPTNDGDPNAVEDTRYL